jgi:hypothetical protein
MDDLKRKAQGLGLWNMFLPKNHFKDGPQFTNVEYGLMAEQLGKSITASEVWTFPFSLVLSLVFPMAVACACSRPCVSLPFLFFPPFSGGCNLLAPNV